MEQSNTEQGNVSTTKKKMNTKLVLAITGSVILFVGACLAIYLYQESRIAKLNDEHKAATTQLEKEKAELKDKLAATKSGTATEDEEKAKNEDTNTDSKPTESTASAVENIHDAVTSRNYAALGSRMTSQVEVAIAATEFGGTKTIAQAIESMNYLNSATGEWSFSIPMSVLTDWHSGYYASYLPTDGGVIGLSSDGYVVTFTLNSENKITRIFMALEDVL